MAVISAPVRKAVYTPASVLKMPVADAVQSAITRFMLDDKNGSFNPSAMRWSVSTLDATLGKSSPASIADAVVWSICAYFHGQINLQKLDGMRAKWFGRAFADSIGGYKATNSMDQERLELYAPMLVAQILKQIKPAVTKPTTPAEPEVPAPTATAGVPMVATDAAKLAKLERAASHRILTARKLKTLRAMVRALQADNARLEAAMAARMAAPMPAQRGRKAA